MRLVTFALAVVIGLAFSPVAFAQSEEDVAANIEAIHGDSQGFFELFSVMQDAMMPGDPMALAASVAYPITISAEGETYEVLTEEDMAEKFDTLFSKKAQEAIRTQDVADLTVTSEGVGFGAGEVWVSNICRDDDCAETYWGIVAINN